MFERFKKKVLLQPKPEQIGTKGRSEITITFKSGGEIGLNAEVDSKKQTIVPFRQFYKWYFGRPQSKHYRFEHSTGEWVIQRDEIKVFRVDYVEKPVYKPSGIKKG